VNWKIVTQAFGQSGKAKILTEQEASDDPAFAYRAKLMCGEMTLTEFSLYNWRGGGGSMWFAPVSQARGSETLKQMALTKQILAKYGWIIPANLSWACAICIISSMLYDKTGSRTDKSGLPVLR
jgi:hypothetical protein